MRLPDYVAGKVAREKLILASGDAMRSQGMEPHLGENIERIDPREKKFSLPQERLIPMIY